MALGDDAMAKKIFSLVSLTSLLLLSPWMQGKTTYRVIIEAPFAPAHRLTLDYPEELKREGTARRFILHVSINKHGKVNHTFVWKSRHSDLEERILREVYRWKFKPFLHKGNPIPAHGFLKVIFYPERVRSRQDMIETGKKPSADPSEVTFTGELKSVLEACADYCEKLSNYALYYVCLERISEKVRKVAEECIGTMASGGGPDLHPTELMLSNLYYLILKDTEKRASIYDYQLVRRNSHIDEKRILLGSTKRTKDKKPAISGAKISYSLQSILWPARLLSREHRHEFSYRLAGDEKVKGKNAYVIEVQPGSGQDGDIKHAEIWVDKENYRILKLKVEAFYLEGYDQVYEECSRYYLTPHFTITHFYEHEKNGILFPSQSEIRIEYSGLVSSKRERKADIDISYSHYRFFTVEVDHNIIKGSKGFF